MALRQMYTITHEPLRDAPLVEVEGKWLKKNLEEVFPPTVKEYRPTRTKTTVLTKNYYGYNA